MRHWMEKADFGKPEEYPTQEDIEKRIQRLVAALGGDPSLPVYVSFSYQTRRGKWSPVPREERSNPRWDPRWRKPQPGMLLQAMADAGVEPHQTLFVGDSQEDQDAGNAAGCAFEWAGEFFGRQWKDCEQLKINLIR
jgi:phosphoglycolate phosphatase-like HAD superfamily hydrolase